jgi:hypothetical protein
MIHKTQTLSFPVSTIPLTLGYLQQTKLIPHFSMNVSPIFKHKLNMFLSHQKYATLLLMPLFTKLFNACIKIKT